MTYDPLSVVVENKKAFNCDMTYDDMCLFYGRLKEINEGLETVTKEANFRGISDQPTRIKEDILEVLVDININVSAIVKKITQ